MTGFASIPPGIRRLLLAHGLSATAMGLPWPALLVLVWEHTGNSAALGIAGAARMAPYVLLSWLAGRLADRVARGRIVKASLLLRLGLLLATAVCMSAGHVTAAVVCACLVVAAGTPAYPALAAEMPSLAGPANAPATGLLVTFEVAAFFTGPAVGGLLLTVGARSAAGWAGGFLTGIALWCVVGVAWTRRSKPEGPDSATGRVSVLRVLQTEPTARAAVGSVVVNNAVLGAVGIALLPLAETAWHGDTDEFGVATAALGAGAFAAPGLLRAWGISAQGGRRSALLLAAFLAAVVVSPGLWWGLVPLAVVGAAAVHVEAVATALIQAAVPDESCSSVLGLADSLMVAAAAVGAAATPSLIDRSDVRVVLAGCAAGSIAMLALFPRIARNPIGDTGPMRPTTVSAPASALDGP